MPVRTLRTKEESDQIVRILEGGDTCLPFSPNALQVMADRYLAKDPRTNKLLETPEEMFYRVAYELAEQERTYGARQAYIDQRVEQYYEVMTSFRFVPAGRTLSNAGLARQHGIQVTTQSNCIVLHIEDSFQGIFGTLYEAALLQKGGSGLGFPFHMLRPTGDSTVTSWGSASGPVSFMHVYDTAFGTIKQQGRHGANMAVMRVDHPDILEFIHCKDQEGDFRNFNISVGITDEFMSQVEAGSKEPWKCTWAGKPRTPRRITRDGKYGTYKEIIEDPNITACEIFAEIVRSAWKNGEPGLVMLDTVNAKNPLPGLGRIEACTCSSVSL